MKRLLLFLLILPCIAFASKPQQQKKQIVVINGYCYKVYFDNCNVLHVELQHECNCPYEKELNIDNDEVE